MKHRIDLGTYEARQVLGSWWGARVEVRHDNQWLVFADIPDFFYRDTARQELFVGRGTYWTGTKNRRVSPWRAAKLNAIVTYALSDLKDKEQDLKAAA